MKVFTNGFFFNDVALSGRDFVLKKVIFCLGISGVWL